IDWDEELHDGLLTTLESGAPGKPPRERPLFLGAPLPSEGPWGKVLPRRYFSWHGQPPQGSLRLLTRAVQVQAFSRNDVQLFSGRADVSARLRYEVLAGAVSEFDICLSSRLAGEVAPKLESLKSTGGEEVRI